MSFLKRALAATFLFLATSAAAHAAPRHMVLGAAAAAPEAYIAFCERVPAECGFTADKIAVAARIARSAWSAALFAKPADAPTGVLADQASSATSTSALPALDPDLWGTLTQVNGQVNQAIRPQVDQRTHGVAEYWSTPLQDGRKFGDCEDYVLEKRHALIAAGVPQSVLNIAVVSTAKGESHAVLVVSTRSGDFVLDNLRRGIGRWDELPYVWRLRQTGGAAFDWAVVTG